jgi:hypothetical protein
VKPESDAEVGTVTTPNGGAALRCSARNRRGERCGRSARTGFDVCHMHGAGSRKREESGEKRPVGRPIIHGLYSQRGRTDIQALMEDVLLAEGALTSSDRELALLKGTLWFLANQSETFVGKVKTFEEATRAIEDTLESYVIVKSGSKGDDTGRYEMTPDDARELGRNIATCFKLVTALESWVMNLAEVTTKTISAHKTRAETTGKLAEARAQEEFVRLVQAVRNVLIQVSPSDDWLDNLEAKLDREVFGANRLEMHPDPTTRPEDLN